MRRSFILLILTLILCSSQSFAANYYFSYNDKCMQAYQYYIALQFDKGNEVIRQQMLADPYNLTATYIADYADCLQLLLNGSKSDYEQLQKHLDARLDLLRRGDDSSPWYRLLQGGIYMHWAFVYVRMGEKFSAATTFRKSFLLLKENQRRFPGFDYNDILFGLEEAVVGTLPEDYSWIASIFGMKGNVNRGVGRLESFLRRHTPQDALYADAAIFYVYTKFYLQSKQEETWRFLNSDAYPATGNLLLSYVKTDLSLNYRKGDAALQTIRQMQGLPEYNKFPIFEYQAGNALLHKLDHDAVDYFRHFLSVYKGGIFVKDALQKLALSYYLMGDMAKAREYRAQIPAQGSTNVDADRQAQRFAREGSWPNASLLQAKLLLDGGYYPQALARLNAQAEASLATVNERAEYNYRLGKAYDDMGEDQKADMYYKKAISIARNDKGQFAARASLQLGLMYESRKNTTAALAFFRDCLNMPVQDFRNSIRQQAKAGINRLGG